MSDMAQTHARNESASAAAVQADQVRQYLTFMLGSEVFAAGILAVKEIIEYTNLTEVPMMPAHVRGVINLRGAVVPVVDLSVRFGRPANAVTKRTCIVIVEIGAGSERHDVGVVVDSVSAVVDIPIADMEPPPSFGARVRTDFIEGVGKVNGKFVILLNVNRVLTGDEIDALGQELAATAAS
jgi:purine-binding chemotaxis protein CheW